MCYQIGEFALRQALRATIHTCEMESKSDGFLGATMSPTNFQTKSRLLMIT